MSTTWLAGKGDGCWVVVRGPGATAIVQGGSYETDKADAYLMAAAQKLLEAAREALRCIEDPYCGKAVAERLLRAAIAKAGAP